jgi:undecaprenyl-diphosphatase
MLDKILSLDTELLIFLNGLGSERFDLWLIITQQLYWTPFFSFPSVFIYKKLVLKPCFLYLSYRCFNYIYGSDD